MADVQRIAERFTNEESKDMFAHLIDLLPEDDLFEILDQKLTDDQKGELVARYEQPNDPGQ